MKKGFTLIEVLAVIVILAIIALIVFPEVNKIIKNSKQKSYDTQINSLIESTKKLALRNPSILPVETSGLASCVTLTTLMNEGELDTDVIYDPRDTNTRLDGVIAITYSDEYHQYIYTYQESCPN